MTNYEKIKNMSVEEMAQYLGKICYLKFVDEQVCTKTISCQECQERWLNKEVSE